MRLHGNGRESRRVFTATGDSHPEATRDAAAAVAGEKDGQPDGLTCAIRRENSGAGNRAVTRRDHIQGILYDNSLKLAHDKKPVEISSVYLFNIMVYCN